MRNVVCLLILLASRCPADGTEELLARARAHAVDYDRDLTAAQRLLHAWLKQADPKTLLLPDRLNRPERVYTPHNSGADLYPYLILTSRLTDAALYRGRMMEMLRNEVRYTNAKAGVPGNLDLNTGKLGAPSLFGAGEYAKDGLITVTEYLGRTAWTDRMIDMMADAMGQANVASDFGPLPAADSELNGDYLQVMPRLYLMTGDARFLDWGRRIADAYIHEVLPGNNGLPSMAWDFQKHTGDSKLKLRDHGNEMIVGLLLQFALETQLGSPQASRYQPVLARMLDRVLESANPDGLLYNAIDTRTLEPADRRLSDNWGYVYGAVYDYYQITGETKYRDAVRRVLSNLGKYRSWCWEPSGVAKDSKLGSFDGYADSIESAIYLVNREPVAAALEWIDSEMKVMLAMQRPDGLVEDWYGEGNFNRTVLLHALMKSRGVRAAQWVPGLQVGAAERDGVLALYVSGAAKVEFDFARHRRVLNFQKNYVRLNEFPEWFTVDENTLYRLVPASGGAEMVRLGSELIAGVDLTAGGWTIRRYSE
ncbi:hypothetical protein [uncultured Paludibaculum sp.]|uniref:hypothetical protein n=1 Tax=uncultured Paludibaculum sp. TaxID=1765020 RepID=UPI002AAAE191|nr:hypothetical protein [uncultured Paludibaculum sp.]